MNFYNFQQLKRNIWIKNDWAAIPGLTGCVLPEPNPVVISVSALNKADASVQEWNEENGPNLTLVGSLILNLSDEVQLDDIKWLVLIFTRHWVDTLHNVMKVTGSKRFESKSQSLPTSDGWALRPIFKTRYNTVKKILHAIAMSFRMVIFEKLNKLSKFYLELDLVVNETIRGRFLTKSSSPVIFVQLNAEWVSFSPTHVFCLYFSSDRDKKRLCWVFVSIISDPPSEPRDDFWSFVLDNSDRQDAVW